MRMPKHPWKKRMWRCEKVKCTLLNKYQLQSCRTALNLKLNPTFENSKSSSQCEILISQCENVNFLTTFLPEMYNMLAIQVIFLHCLDMILSVHVLIVILSMFVPIDGTLSHRKCKKREKICAIGWKPYFGVDVIFRPFPLSLCTSATSAAAANRFLHDYFLENWNHLKKLNQTRIMKTRTRKGFLQDFSSSKVALVKTH